MTTRGVTVAAILLTLAVCAKPVEADSVTYDFVESGLNPGAIGAVLVFASPPSSASGEWDTLDGSDILSFKITNGFFAPVGLYNTSITTDVQSLTGAKLDSGTISGILGGVAVTTTIGTSPFANVLQSNHGKFMYGHWVLSPTAVLVAPDVTVHTPVPSAGFVPAPHGFTTAPLRSPRVPIVTSSAVPEPSSLVLAGTAALIGIGTWRRRCLPG